MSPSPAGRPLFLKHMTSLRDSNGERGRSCSVLLSASDTPAIPSPREVDRPVAMQLAPCQLAPAPRSASVAGDATPREVAKSSGRSASMTASDAERQLAYETPLNERGTELMCRHAQLR
jgi:hypothetical protein